MKQHITKEQWVEIDDDDVQLLIKDLIMEHSIFPWEFITIGQMLAYLGADFDSMLKSTSYEVLLEIDDEITPFRELEPVDSLWEAVKFKLNK